MNIEEFKNKLDINGLGKYFDKFQPLLRNTIRFYQQATDENTIAIGQTKIGGRPDLPTEIKWVTETNVVETIKKKFLVFNSKKEEIITKPLSFIAQINLAETKPFDKENLLPKTGLLYFFYSAEQESWGFDHKDKNKFKVIYWNGSLLELKRTEFPSDLPEYSCYKPCSVVIKSEVSLPSYGHDIYADFTDEETDKYWEEVYNDENLNKLLGYSDNIQGEMELECELVTNGLYCGDSSGYNDLRAKALEPNAKNWRLLMQIDSNEENEMMWGDCGRLYFWIKIDDLLNKQFDKSWFSLQCS
ncbi:YwqG family protein [Flavobacterium filum]|uniref:YwqG family protein n=1 Tax=Flavobacterium filum TaxID=370974 RepID=UPI0023F53998|nr:YwqG family protein [Flavobacterium filum]